MSCRSRFTSGVISGAGMLNHSGPAVFCRPAPPTPLPPALDPTNGVSAWECSRPTAAATQDPQQRPVSTLAALGLRGRRGGAPSCFSKAGVMTDLRITCGALTACQIAGSRGLRARISAARPEHEPPRRRQRPLRDVPALARRQRHRCRQPGPRRPRPSQLRRRRPWPDTTASFQSPYGAPSAAGTHRARAPALLWPKLGLA